MIDEKATIVKWDRRDRNRNTVYETPAGFGLTFPSEEHELSMYISIGYYRTRFAIVLVYLVGGMLIATGEYSNLSTDAEIKSEIEKVVAPWESVWRNRVTNNVDAFLQWQKSIRS